MVVGILNIASESNIIGSLKVKKGFNLEEVINNFIENTLLRK